MAKHGARYAGWDPSDFTVRMLIQRWLRTRTAEVGGPAVRDLGAFWGNGSLGEKRGTTSPAVAAYNRLAASLLARPPAEATAAAAAAVSSAESDSEDGQLEAFVAQSDESDGSSEGAAQPRGAAAGSSQAALDRAADAAEAQAFLDNLPAGRRPRRGAAAVAIWRSDSDSSDGDSDSGQRWLLKPAPAQPQLGVPVDA